MVMKGCQLKVGIIAPLTMQVKSPSWISSPLQRQY